jgi:hypothetical protein
MSSATTGQSGSYQFTRKLKSDYVIRSVGTHRVALRHPMLLVDTGGSDTYCTSPDDYRRLGPLVTTLDGDIKKRCTEMSQKAQVVESPDIFFQFTERGLQTT